MEEKAPRGILLRKGGAVELKGPGPEGAKDHPLFCQVRSGFNQFGPA